MTIRAFTQRAIYSYRKTLKTLKKMLAAVSSSQFFVKKECNICQCFGEFQLKTLRNSRDIATSFKKKCFTFRMSFQNLTNGWRSIWYYGAFLSIAKSRKRLFVDHEWMARKSLTGRIPLNPRKIALKNVFKRTIHRVGNLCNFATCLIAVKTFKILVKSWNSVWLLV